MTRRSANAALLFWAVLPAVGCGPRTMDEDTIAYAKAYIRFQNVRLSAKEAYSGQTVYFLRIDVVNNGTRAVKELDVVLYFYDTSGKLVNMERATAISPRLRPLGPREKRDFQHGFDMPPDWNRTSPNIGIAFLDLK
jgi:hypothetical protein